MTRYTVWNILLFPLALMATSCTYTFYASGCDYDVPVGLKRTATLSDSLPETSGLAVQDSFFISFNDSGGEPALYSFNDSGRVLVKTEISHATNSDWESMTSDSRYYYIADVGNNYGTRDTLYIYKIPRAEGGMPSILRIEEVISFSYDEPVSRNRKGLFSHDCEAIFVYNDSLYLFAKDWISFTTRVYVLPVVDGHYNIQSRTSYNVNALITGADIDAVHREVVLVGYNDFIPVMIRYGFEADPSVISCGGKARRFIMRVGTQVEGVAYDPSGRIYATSEKSLYKQALFQAY